MPTSLFPNFTGGGTGLQDTPAKTEIEFHYLANGERSSMIWRRNKSWNRSFMGRKNGRQPERQLYLRTLANLASPSEVRSLLQLARQDLNTEQIGADLLIFAHRSGARRCCRRGLRSCAAAWLWTMARCLPGIADCTRGASALTFVRSGRRGRRGRIENAIGRRRRF